jgi:hypothetical protein
MNTAAVTAVCACHIIHLGWLTVANHSSLTTHTVEEMVGATGIEPVTPTMSTQQSAAA